MNAFFPKQSKLAAIFCIAITITACGNSHQQAYKYKLNGELSSSKIPASVAAAIEQLDKVLPAQAKHDLVLCDKNMEDEFCRQFEIHFRIALEREIRNKWFSGLDSQLSKQLIESGITDPELMSSRLLEIYLQHLSTESGTELGSMDTEIRSDTRTRGDESR